MEWRDDATPHLYDTSRYGERGKITRGNTGTSHAGQDARRSHHDNPDSMGTETDADTDIETRRTGQGTTKGHGGYDRGEEEEENREERATQAARERPDHSGRVSCNGTVRTAHRVCAEKTNVFDKSFRSRHSVNKMAALNTMKSDAD